MKVYAPSQINALTATRAVAALLVFVHHFGRNIFPFSKAPYFFSSGNLAVSYFFVLSGFVLFINYCSKDIVYKDYLLRRVARIVPVYLIALLGAVLVAMVFSGYHPSGPQQLREIVYSGLLIQAYIPGYPLVLNGPGWTISVEMLFYVLFPLMLLLQKKNFSIFFIVALLLFALSQYFHLKYYTRRHELPDSIVDTVFFNPVIHMSQFFIGMMGGQLFFWIKQRINEVQHRWLPAVLFLIIVMVIAYRPEHISYHVGLIAPLFMLFIVSVAVCEPRTLTIKGFVYLGEISYGIYILQQPVYSFFDNMNTRYVHMPPQPFFWMAMLLLIGVASVSYQVLELPLRRVISALTFNTKVASANRGEKR